MLLKKWKSPCITGMDVTCLKYCERFNFQVTELIKLHHFRAKSLNTEQKKCGFFCSLPTLCIKKWTVGWKLKWQCFAYICPALDSTMSFTGQMPLLSALSSWWSVKFDDFFLLYYCHTHTLLTMSGLRHARNFTPTGIWGLKFQMVEKNMRNLWKCKSLFRIVYINPFLSKPNYPPAIIVSLYENQDTRAHVFSMASITYFSDGW